MKEHPVTTAVPMTRQTHRYHPNANMLALAAAFLVLSSFYLTYSWNRYQKIAASEAVILAESLEVMIHPEHVATLTGRPEDLESTEYKLAKTDLLRLVRTTNPIHVAYLLALRNNEIIFLVDSEPPDSKDYAEPGQIYTEADPIYKQPFLTGRTVLTGLVEDRWGRWISALVPVKDPDNGQVLAVFGIDYDASEWMARLYRQMIPDLVVVCSLFLFLAALLYTLSQQATLKTLSENLAYDETLYHHIFTQAPIGIALVEGHNFVLEAAYGHNSINPVFEQILGRSGSELDQVSWSDITHPQDLPADLDCFKRFQNGDIQDYILEKRFIRPDGTSIWTNMRVARLQGLPNSKAMHLCLLEDITARKKIEEELLESERSKSVLLSNLPGMAYRCRNDRDWTMLFVSDGCQNLTGHKAESLIKNRDLSFNELISPPFREQIWHAWQKTLLQRAPFRYEYEITTATGEKKWVLELAEGVYQDHGKVEALEGIILDISDRKDAEEKLSYTAEHDPGTGLYNRAYLENLLRLESEKPPTSKQAIIGINLNSMYYLSLSYGFGYSHDILRSIANVLRTFCDESKLLFRSYEYRFIFYLKDYESHEALQAFCEAVAETLTPLLAAERIGAGMGVLELDEDNRRHVDLILRNVLLTTEKSLRNEDNGIHVLFFDQNMAMQISREDKIKKELVQISDGIRSERLYMQYQPILNLNQGKICGFEALARLTSDHFGRVPPNEFIPIAEKNKLIVQLGDVIIIKALQFLQKLQQKGYNQVSVSINISAVQLLRSDFSSNLIDQIKRWQINPAQVGLELTESIFASNYDEINRIIRYLRALGIKIAIDDFGTGYSSLAREREIYANYLKIDKHFIDKLLEAKTEATITSDIISMGHKLGHCVIAEGVEYETQLSYLRENGCDLVQGYLISKPLDDDQAIEHLIHDNPSSNG